MRCFIPDLYWFDRYNIVNLSGAIDIQHGQVGIT